MSLIHHTLEGKVSSPKLEGKVSSPKLEGGFTLF